MNWLLAIDCTDQACSVALGNETGMSERFTAEPRQHAQKVLPMMRELLAEAGIAKSQLDAIAVAVGPGSFTGLRIALSASQSLSYALDKPLVSVSSLYALSMAYKAISLESAEDRSIFVGLDARMGEVYCAAFVQHASGNHVRHTDDLLLSQDDAADMAKTCDIGFGSALSLPSFEANDFVYADPKAQVHAADVLRIGQQEFMNGHVVKTLALEPSYLRREDAWKKLDQQR